MPRGVRQSDLAVETIARAVGNQRPGNAIFDVLVADDFPQAGGHLEIPAKCLELPPHAGKQPIAACSNRIPWIAQNQLRHLFTAPPQVQCQRKGDQGAVAIGSDTVGATALRGANDPDKFGSHFLDA